ncbi:Clotting factor B [Portunus trituberculatus]|uniref:Clotting factor B n=1 Tax=Portunus trituberculatus TaxID=210409 RepID=A0A5B7HPW1_PORTR|nr:Clotting factor B [Portunus trituberculatus]
MNTGSSRRSTASTTSRNSTAILFLLIINGYHDLALLKLESKVTLQTFISPVCLPWGSKSEENIVNSQATVTGWGFTLFGGFPSPELMEVDIQVFPSSRCNSSYSSLLHFPDTWPRGIGEETLCAGDDEGGKDSCQVSSVVPPSHLP